MKHLEQIAELIGSDSRRKLVKNINYAEIEAEWVYDLDLAELQASKLTEDEKFDIAFGEEEVMTALVESKDLSNLATVLNDIFDGTLTEYFLTY